MTQDKKQPVVLAAGGTGGHIFPAEALAEVLMGMGERVVLVTDSRFAQFKTGALSRVEIRTIKAGTVGGGLVKKIKGLVNLGLGILQARAQLRDLKPKVVVGFGGYPSFPTVFSAAKLGIPTVIHEQNSVLGRANRLLARKVTCIAVSLPNTQMIVEADKGKMVMTGNPVRTSIRALKDVPYASISGDSKMHLLVTGGSLGASVFSDVVPQAIAKLPANLRARIRIDQQCREAELGKTEDTYRQMGVNVDLAPFFVDIPARLASAHLVIARSGASTVAELAAAGRPGILVPLPSAMDNHQYFNAIALEEVGGGWVMTQDGFTADSLAARLEAFLTAPATLTKAAENASRLGSPDAAEKLAALVLRLARGEGHAEPGSSDGTKLKYVAALVMALLVGDPSYAQTGNVRIFYDPNGNPPNWCRNGDFAGLTADYDVGQITAKTPLLSDDDSPAEGACPSVDAAKCPVRRSIDAKRSVVVSKALGSFYCVYDPKDSVSGWVHSAQLDIAPKNNIPLAQWVGVWSNGEDTIEITRENEDLHVSGEALWYGAVLASGDQVVHTGELDFTGRPQDNKLRYFTNDPNDCGAELIHLGRYLLVRDNGHCGGVNVRFNGIYAS